MPDEGGRLMTPPLTANRAWVEKEPHGVRGVKEVLIAGQAGGLARRAGRPPLGAVDVEDRVPAALRMRRRVKFHCFKLIASYAGHRTGMHTH
jgi:hypothetical protein